jgi:hypothetical protein
VLQRGWTQPGGVAKPGFEIRLFPVVRKERRKSEKRNVSNEGDGNNTSYSPQAATFGALPTLPKRPRRTGFDAGAARFQISKPQSVETLRKKPRGLFHAENQTSRTLRGGPDREDD